MSSILPATLKLWCKECGCELNWAGNVINNNISICVDVCQCSSAPEDTEPNALSLILAEGEVE